MRMPRFQHGWLPQFTQITDVLGSPQWVARVRLRDYPGDEHETCKIPDEDSTWLDCEDYCGTTPGV